MGLLADIGRSNIPQVTNNLLNGVNQLVRTQTEVQSQDIQDRINLAKLNTVQKEQEELHRPQNMRNSVIVMSLPEEEREPFVQKMIADGAADPDGTSSMFRRNKYLSENKEAAGFVLSKKVENARLLFDKAYQGVETAMASGNPDKIKMAQAQMKSAGAYLAGLEGKYKDAMSAFDENKDGSYTLAPGAKRYGPDGKLISENPNEASGEVNALRRDQLAETSRHNKEMERLAADKAKGGGKKDLGFADKEAIRAMGKQLPKSKVAAETAVKNVQKTDRMLALIDQGAGGVKGEILAKINKVVDIMRRTPPEDAKYNTLKAELRGFAGQLRLQLGLIGQTSDRDVAIMYEAAGGATPAESQKAILEGYRQGYVQDITNYNSDAAAYSEYSDVAKTAYKPIPVPTRGAAPAASAPNNSVPADLPQGTKNNGDGTFTLPNGQRVRPKK